MTNSQHGRFKTFWDPFQCFLLEVNGPVFTNNVFLVVDDGVS